MATKIKVILDRSGSMNIVGEVTAEKFNEYINGVNVDRGKKKVLVSLHQFDDQYQTDFEDVPVQDVEPLVYKKNYVPRGMTALLDAIGKTMAGQKLGKRDKGICVIITDGYENSSQEWTEEKVAELIKDLEDNSAWTFVYLGANQDAFSVAQSFGIRTVDKTLSYGNDDFGNTVAYDSLRSATGRTMAMAASAGMANTNQYFTEDERKKAEKTRGEKLWTPGDTES
jgi:hypothetical protein